MLSYASNLATWSLCSSLSLPHGHLLGEQCQWSNKVFLFSLSGGNRVFLPQSLSHFTHLNPKPISPYCFPLQQVAGFHTACQFIPSYISPTKTNVKFQQHCHAISCTPTEPNSYIRIQYDLWFLQTSQTFSAMVIRLFYVVSSQCLLFSSIDKSSRTFFHISLIPPGPYLLFDYLSKIKVFIHISQELSRHLLCLSTLQSFLQFYFSRTLRCCYMTLFVWSQPI